VEWPLRGGRGGGGKRKRGKEREKRGRNEENGGEKLEQGRRLAKAGPDSAKRYCDHASLLVGLFVRYARCDFSESRPFNFREI